MRPMRARGPCHLFVFKCVCVLTLSGSRLPVCAVGWACGAGAGAPTPLTPCHAMAARVYHPAPYERPQPSPVSSNKHNMFFWKNRFYVLALYDPCSAVPGSACVHATRVCVPVRLRCMSGVWGRMPQLRLPAGLLAACLLDCLPFLSAPHTWAVSSHVIIPHGFSWHTHIWPGPSRRLPLHPMHGCFMAGVRFCAWPQGECVRVDVCARPFCGAALFLCIGPGCRVGSVRSAHQSYPLHPASKPCLHVTFMPYTLHSFRRFRAPSGLLFASSVIATVLWPPLGPVALRCCWH